MIATRRLVGTVLGVSGVVITLCFWALDCRNVILVEADERLLKVVEGKMREVSGLPEFETIKHTDEAAPRWIRYGVIMPLLFGSFILLSVGGIWLAGWRGW